MISARDYPQLFFLGIFKNLSSLFFIFHPAPMKHMRGKKSDNSWSVKRAEIAAFKC